MSKTGELKMLRYGRSIDAPINYHHRTGDSEGSGGNMLDLYAQEGSAEEVYFGNADEHAREMFLKGFKVYLKKVYNEQEREFLKRLLLGKESPFKIGQSLGVEHFDFLQGIQLKAFKKAKPLIKLALRTGWSGAETFTETIYKRLEQLSAGFSLNEILPQNERILEKRKKKNKAAKRYYKTNKENQLKANKRWCKAHPEKVREMKRRYRQAHPEKEREMKRRYRQAHPEKVREMKRRYRQAHPEKAREMKEYQKAYYAKRKALKEAENAAKIANDNLIVCLPYVQE